MSAVKVKQNNNFGIDIQNIKGAAGLVASINALNDNINKGKVEFKSTSTIAANIGINDAINPNWIFEVSGNTNFHSYILANGFVNIQNKLDVKDDVSFGDHLEVHGDASFNKTLELSDNAIFT